MDRLKKQLAMLRSIPAPAKFGGATGNFNAHMAAYPQVDWVAFANRFVNGVLRLDRSQVTTQDVYKRQGLDFGRDPAAENRIARFTHMLGINASIDYGCNGSGAAVKNIKKTFEGYGYHTDGVMSYTWDRVREDIDHGLPVFTAATPLSGDRHAWVIDGYKYGYYLTDVFMDVYDACLLYTSFRLTVVDPDGAKPVPAVNRLF